MQSICGAIWIDGAIEIHYESDAFIMKRTVIASINTGEMFLWSGLMKVLTVVGARPQFIKAAVLSRHFFAMPEFEEQIVHTGQHYDYSMSDVFFEELELPIPKYNLNVGSESHAVQTGKILAGFEELLNVEVPDLVVVYGDTNSTLAASLAAAKLQFPVAHVEAGLRSYDRSMPEEINRRMTDHLAVWNFCPTQVAVENLRNEGITERVFQVGDVMLDALMKYAPSDREFSLLRELKLEGRPYALCTIHRAGNTDNFERFHQLWESVNRLAAELQVVLPLHPRTRKVVRNLGLSNDSCLHLIEPVSYRQMLALESNASLVVTDSGGVQKESYLHGVPCLTLRESTEWTETVDAGWNKLVGASGHLLLDEARKFLKNGPPHTRPQFYGDGRACQKIVEVLRAA